MEEEKDGKLICEQIMSFEEAMQANGAPLFRRNYSANQNTGIQRQMSQVRPAIPEKQASAVQTAAGKASYPNGVWIQFATPEEYAAKEMLLYQLTAESDGNDPLVIFVKNPKGFKVLPPNRNVRWDEALKQSLCQAFGQENVRFRG